MPYCDYCHGGFLLEPFGRWDRRHEYWYCRPCWQWLEGEVQDWWDQQWIPWCIHIAEVWKARVTMTITVTMMIITPPFKPRHDDDSDGDDDDDVRWSKNNHKRNYIIQFESTFVTLFQKINSKWTQATKK